MNVAQWQSADDFCAAHGPQFRAMVSGPGWAKFSSRPALYEVINQTEAAGQTPASFLE